MVETKMCEVACNRQFVSQQAVTLEICRQVSGTT